MDTFVSTRARRARRPSCARGFSLVAAARNDARVVRAVRASIDALESRVLLSTTLRAAADAYVWENQPTTNFGSAATLEVKDSASTNDRWSYVRFDLTGVDSV